MRAFCKQVGFPRSDRSDETFDSDVCDHWVNPLVAGNFGSIPQSPGVEFANSLIHGLALLAAIAATPFLIAVAGRFGVTSVVGVAIFAATMVLMFLSSTLYHASPAGPAKRVLLKLDYGAIYLFMAGSYTPFALGATEAGSSRWAVFGLVWTLAILGAALKAFDRPSCRPVSTALYLAMGWLVLIAAAPWSSVCRRKACACCSPEEPPTRWAPGSSLSIPAFGTLTRYGTDSSSPALAVTFSRCSVIRREGSCGPDRDGSFSESRAVAG